MPHFLVTIEETHKSRHLVEADDIEGAKEQVKDDPEASEIDNFFSHAEPQDAWDTVEVTPEEASEYRKGNQ